MSDPSLLVTRPTATDPSLAPPGRHLHYILAPCPNTALGPGAAAWGELGPRYRDSLLRELERRGLDGIRGGRRRGVPRHPSRLARAGACGRHAVLGGPHLPADGPLPAAEPGARHGERRTRRVRHHPGCRGADLPGVGELAAARITGGTVRPANRPAPARAEEAPA